MLKSFITIFVSCLIIFNTQFLISCGKDEPRQAEGVTVPSGPRDPDNDDNNNNGEGEGNDNENSNSDQEKEDENGIEGEWNGVNNQLKLIFYKDGQFTAYNGSILGLHDDEKEIAEGSYRYEKLNQWLWLSIEAKKEVYILEYRCIADENNLTLYRMTGNGINLKKLD